MPASPAIVRTPGVLTAEVDGDLVLMHPTDYSYYGLTETGTAVWELVDGTRSIDAIVSALAQEFDSSATTIRADVQVFLAGLETAGFISYAV